MPRRKKLPKVIPGSDPERLVEAAATERDRLVILLGLLAGLRVAEVVGLDVRDIDLAGRVLYVREGKGGKDRNIALAARLLDPLRAWIGDRRDGPLFQGRGGTRLSRRALQHMIVRTAERAGIHHTTMHMLRHTFATRLLNRGATIMDVKELLGHSSISTTEVYLHVSTDRLRSVVDTL